MVVISKEMGPNKNTLHPLLMCYLNLSWILTDADVHEVTMMQAETVELHLSVGFTYIEVCSFVIPDVYWGVQEVDMYA